MTKSLISLDKVDKIYPGGFQALHQISLDVAPGEVIAIVGHAATPGASGNTGGSGTP